jgi:hypothetical protein
MTLARPFVTRQTSPIPAFPPFTARTLFNSRQQIRRFYFFIKSNAIKNSYKKPAAGQAFSRLFSFLLVTPEILRSFAYFFLKENILFCHGFLLCAACF